MVCFYWHGSIKMRSIGKRNIRLVKETTLKLIKKDVLGFKTIPSIDMVISKLPLELWNTWEGCHQEICNIIRETINGSD